MVVKTIFDKEIKILNRKVRIDFIKLRSWIIKELYRCQIIELTLQKSIHKNKVITLSVGLFGRSFEIMIQKIKE